MLIVSCENVYCFVILSLKLAFGFKEFPHPPQNTLLGMNAAAPPFSMSTIGPPFFLATVMFGFVFQMTSLVTEKELKLRQVSNFP